MSFANSILFTAEPKEVYEVAQWIADDKPGDDNRIMTKAITASANATVAFKTKIYTIRFETDGSTHLPYVQIPHSEKILSPLQ